MNATNSIDRRQWMKSSSMLAAAAATLAPWQSVAAAEGASGPMLLKTLKIGMIRVEGSLTEKFKAAKEAGFHGVELDAPGFNVDEVLKAIDESGLPVDGSVCSSHWGVRHTDPDPKIREQALETLKQALRTTHAVGGHTVLLVLGHGKDGPEEEIWKRSMENLQQAIPLAAELGVAIAIENVWNQFLYNHDGDGNQTADKFVKYVDEANSPWVGMQFDIGNHWKYGNPGAWIRALGKRIIKLDIKGFSRETNTFTKIGEDDLPWADVRSALAEINFHGWVAAEVSGGGPDRLREIVANMDRVLGSA